VPKRSKDHRGENRTEQQRRGLIVVGNQASAQVASVVSSQSITNSSPVVFDITGSGTVKGLFLVGGAAGAQTKGDNAASGAILWATALFGSGDVAVNADDQLKVTYTVSA